MPDDENQTNNESLGQQNSKPDSEPKKSTAEAHEETLSELLGVENLGQIFYTDKKGNLYGAAGKDFGIAKLEHDGSLNFQVPNKAPTPIVGEEITLRADKYDRRFLTDGSLWIVQGMSYQGSPIFVLNQQIPDRAFPGKTDNLVAWFDSAMKPQYLYYSGLILSRGLLYTKVRNVLSFNGKLESIEVTSSAELKVLTE